MDKRRLITLENKLRQVIQEAVEDGWRVMPWDIEPISSECILMAVTRSLSGDKINYRTEASRLLKISNKARFSIEAGFEKWIHTPEKPEPMLYVLGFHLREECLTLFGDPTILRMAREHLTSPKVRS